MRLLFLNHNVAWSGGTFYRAYHLARALMRRGHAVTLVTISPRRRFGFDTRDRDGVTVVESPDLLAGSARSGWDLWDAWRRVLWARSHAFDVVHAFDSRPAVVLPALSVQRRGVPLVMDWSDWWGRGGTIEERRAGARVKWLIRPIETFFEEHFRSRAQGTTAISSALEARAVVLGVPPETILHLPNGSDVESVKPQSRQNGRARTEVAAETPLLGYLGTLLQGDAELLFQALDRIHRVRPQVRLVLIGNPKAPVPPHPAIIRTGFVKHDEMLAWLASCDVLLLPQCDTIANRARWPSKVNDYLAAGRPVLATAVGDVTRVFDRASIGQAVGADADQLATAAVALLDDEPLREVMGAAARRLAEDLFAWPRLAANLEEFYVHVRNES